ncbi:MAG TPA: AI-2E family transporter [Terriglobales bacterium]|nr:AI-2E family transporter [Terriglobales bacterium]
MRLVDRRALRVFVTATLYGVALALVYFAWQAVVAIIFAFLFAYLLEPLIKLVERHLWKSRMGAVAVAYLVFAAVLAGAFFLLGERVSRESQRIAHEAPQYWQQIRAGQVPPQMAAKGGSREEKIQQALVRWAATNQGRIEQWARQAMKYAAYVAVFAFWAVVVLVLGIFVLKDKDRWIASLSCEPDAPQNRRRMHRMLVEIDKAMARYIWAQVLLSLIAFGVFAGVLSLLHMPFALLLAALQGLLEFVFVFGPLAAGVVILGAALFSGHNLPAVFGFLVAWRIVQDYVNTPLLFGKRLEMHPLGVVVVLMIGWSIGNVIGMFLAVPLAAAAQIVWEVWTANGTPGKDVAELFEEAA